MLSMKRILYDPALAFVESRKARTAAPAIGRIGHPTLSIALVDAGLSHFRCSDVAAT